MTMTTVKLWMNTLCCIPCETLYRILEEPVDIVTNISELVQALENAEGRRIELDLNQRLVLTGIRLNEYLKKYNQNPQGLFEIVESVISREYELLIVGDDFQLKSITLDSGKQALAVTSSEPLILQLVIKWGTEKKEFV